MRRLPVLAFAALAAATAGAFFVTQHLKVTTPLIAGAPSPSPASINPYGSGCGARNREARISFYLLHRADDVSVYVVDQSGSIVRTIASGRHMRRSVRKPDGEFAWNGRKDDGTVAPDGVYHFRVALHHQGRTVDLAGAPVTVRTVHPAPVVRSVSPQLIPQGGASVTIRYAGNEDRGGTVRIYRTDLPGKPRLVKSFLTPWKGQTAIWDGKIHQLPAPAGTYLVGLDVTDAACNTGHFPPVLPPAPGSTPHAGVTVRYLAAEPPLQPAHAGSSAIVYVDSRRQRYRWTLWRMGERKPIRSGRSARVVLRVRLPAGRPALYELTVALTAGGHSTAVPIVASGVRRSRMLVVLPALSWQGANPVDDDGDGIPNTLESGGPVNLSRPLAIGVPGDFSSDLALLRYLEKAHLPYELTTDVALALGSGPKMARYAGVVFAGSERWLPDSLATLLRSYLPNGGHVLSLGIDSLRRGVTLRDGKASDPTAPSSSDALGARIGALVNHNHDLITVIQDRLGIFSSTSGALAGFGSYQAIGGVEQPAQVLSAAGVSAASASIVGFHVGRGTVVEIGLPGFASALAGNVDAQELLNRLWTVLSK